MDKLVITSTVDSSVSYPANHRMPAIEDVETVAQEYIRAVDAGASITHIHGVHYMEDALQPDGKKLSRTDFEGWRKLQALIKDSTDAIVQFGIASARLEEKQALMTLSPEMMSFAFNVHDERFHSDPNTPPMEMYALHDREELVAYCRSAKEYGVKPEIECFFTGAYWNIEYVRSFDLLDDPVWATLFLGWPGGAWSPPTVASLLYLVDNLPARINWNVSVMDPVKQWRILPTAIALGGHVRVGWEDNPYLPDGSLSRTNAELVEVVVRMAASIGREIASPAEARQIIGLSAADGNPQE